MTTTNDRRCEVNEQEVKEQAESVFAGESCPTPMEWETTRRVLISRIRYALLAAYDEGVKAATPPKGHILDDTGTVRRVLGALPLTADGCVVGIRARLHYHEEPFEASQYPTQDVVFFDDITFMEGDAMSKHTPEPWNEETHARSWRECGGIITTIFRAMPDADYSRAIKCVSALADRDPSKLADMEKEAEQAAVVFDEWSMPTPAAHLRAVLAAFRKENQQ